VHCGSRGRRVLFLTPHGNSLMQLLSRCRPGRTRWCCSGLWNQAAYLDQTDSASQFGRTAGIVRPVDETIASRARPAVGTSASRVQQSRGGQNTWAIGPAAGGFERQAPASVIAVCAARSRRTSARADGVVMDAEVHACPPGGGCVRGRASPASNKPSDPISSATRWMNPESRSTDHSVTSVRPGPEARGCQDVLDELHRRASGARGALSGARRCDDAPGERRQHM